MIVVNLSDKQVRRLMGTVNRLGGTAVVDSLEKEIRDRPPQEIDLRKRRADPWVTNTAFGAFVVDPTDGSGQTRPIRPSDLTFGNRMMHPDVHIDPSGDVATPAFDRIIESVTEGSPDGIQAIWDLLASSLFESSRESVLSLVCRSGAGKSTLAQAVVDAWGGYGRKLRRSFLELSHHVGGNPTDSDALSLMGCRVVLVDEFTQGVQGDWVRLGSVCGGNTNRITVRRMREDQTFTVDVVANFMLCSNEVIPFPGSEDAIARRMAVVDSELTLPQAGLGALMDALEAEKSAIVSRAASLLPALFARWPNGRHRYPESLLCRGIALQREGNPVARFADAMLERRAGSSVTSKDMFAAYEDFTGPRAAEEMTPNKFARGMTKLGFKTVENVRGYERGYRGVALRAPIPGEVLDFAPPERMPRDEMAA